MTGWPGKCVTESLKGWLTGCFDWNSWGAQAGVSCLDLSKKGLDWAGLCPL